MRMLIGVAGLVLCLGLSEGLRAHAQSPALPGLTVREGVLMKDGNPYRGVGANYFDLFRRILHNPSDHSSLEGLARLSQAGVPFVRYAAGGWTADWKRYLDDKAEYFRCMDRVVAAAEKNHIGLIPSLFWTFDLHVLANEHKDQWGQSDSKTIQLMRNFIADMAERYKHSPAIWGWEFGNEPNLQVDLPNAKDFRRKGGTERDDLKSAHLGVALREFAAEVRRHDPYRIILTGNSHSRASAWHNTHENSWKQDSKEQGREVLLRDNPAPVDSISIHLYGDAPVQKELAGWTSSLHEYLEWIMGVAREHRRPVFIGEFGLSSEKKDPAEVRAIYEQLIDAMETARVDLAAFWVFDLPAQTSTGWNVNFENERAYMLDLAIQAHRRWNAAAGRP